jgi:hypothetical protein
MSTHKGGLPNPTREKYTHSGAHRRTTPNARETDGAGKGVTLGKVQTPRKDKKQGNNKMAHVPYQHTNKQHQPRTGGGTTTHAQHRTHPQRMKTRTPPPPTRTSIATGEHTRKQRGAHASQASKQAHPAPNAKKTRPTTTTKQLRRNTHTNDPRGGGCLAKAGWCTHPHEEK